MQCVAHSENDLRSERNALRTKIGPGGTGNRVGYPVDTMALFPRSRQPLRRHERPPARPRQPFQGLAHPHDRRVAGALCRKRAARVSAECSKGGCGGTSVHLHLSRQGASPRDVCSRRGSGRALFADHKLDDGDLVGLTSLPVIYSVWSGCRAAASVSPVAPSIPGWRVLRISRDVRSAAWTGDGRTSLQGLSGRLVTTTLIGDPRIDDARWALGPREAHVWHLAADNEADAGAYDRWWDLLSHSERGRASRFVVPADRHRFVLAHAALRVILSRYIRNAPTLLTFETNAYGRPELSTSAGGRPLRFNLSHTYGLIAVAVCREYDIGVDVECTLRRSTADWFELAARFFSPFETAALRRLANEQRDQRFLQVWTLKEAYIKARGLGLSIPLHAFSFDLTDDAPPGDPHRPITAR